MTKFGTGTYIAYKLNELPHLSFIFFCKKVHQGFFYLCRSAQQRGKCRKQLDLIASLEAFNPQHITVFIPFLWKQSCDHRSSLILCSDVPLLIWIFQTYSIDNLFHGYLSEKAWEYFESFDNAPNCRIVYSPPIWLWSQ